MAAYEQWGRGAALSLCLLVAPATADAACRSCTFEELIVMAQQQPGGKGPDGQPIIFWKIMEEDRQGVADLLDQGYDIETKGGFGMTPVLQAAMIDDWITVEYLLQRGAEPMAADRRGFTVPYRATTTKVSPDGAYGQALQRVRVLLNERGIGGTVHKPADVKKMLAAGQWPPA